MADIKDMSREEIEQYLANMPKNTAEPSVKQETAAAETMRGADGNYDVSKVNLSKMFSDKANERGYTDNTTGERKSYNKGSKWQAYIDENITDPAAKADMEKQIYDIVSANPNMSSKELKFRLRAVEANLRRRYPNGVSKNFDISGKMLDRTMAKDLLALGLKGNNKPAETPKPEQPKPEQPKPAETPKAETPKGPTTNDELNAAFKRIKNKQASDADLALFSKYSEEQLKKMGFGPISIAAIKGKKEEPKSAQQAAQQSIEEKYLDSSTGKKPEGGSSNFLNTGGFGARPDKQPKDNTKTIKKLKQQLEVHKKILAENPDKKVQDIQQNYIDYFTKKIEKLGGSVE